MKPLIHLLDDEPGMITALTRLLNAAGFDTKGHTRISEFLAAYRSDIDSCLILDIAMPEMDGMELQRRLSDHGVLVPIIFLTGHGDIPMSVQAMKAGAVDFLTKPVNAPDLLRSVREGLARSAGQRDLRQFAERLHRLTPREREVLDHVITGQLNKQIAAELGTGEQNIKIHRSRAMQKLGVVSLAELVSAAERLGMVKNHGPNGHAP
jgi:FixJ family two-component response regulator